MLRMSKKEAMFFTYFGDMAEYANKAATLLEEMMSDYTDVEAKITKISEIEHACDQVVHEVLHKTNVAFITPIDREDIFLIVKELDNIVDYIEESAYRFETFNVSAVQPDAKEFASLIVKSTVALKDLTREMINLKTGKAMLDIIIEINRLENVGDHKYREVIKDLFFNEKDAINLVRWQGIYSYLERALDACEYVANVIEGVVLKHG